MPDAQDNRVTYTAEDLVRRYIELRDFVDEEKKAFVARLKPYVEAMELIENAAQKMLLQTGQRALSTDFGTAFPVAKTRYSVSDADTWHAWVRERQAWSMYTNHISKEALENWLEATKDPETGALDIPPGVKVETWEAVQFRRA